MSNDDGPVKIARETVRDLSVLLPCWYPIQYKRVKLPDGDWGDITLLHKPTKHFLMRLHSRLRGDELRELIAHEWAHALSWSLNHQTLGDHGPEWGLSYSRCYRAVFGVD